MVDDGWVKDLWGEQLEPLTLAGTPGPSPRSGLRVLLAEDNAVNQKVALLMLSRLGYHADVVANGVEVLAALHRAAYDVVLMGIQLPEMDGLEATRRIRLEFSPLRQPTIIAMTANAAQIADGGQQLFAGMDGCLSKPVRMEQLAAAMTACEAQHQAATTASGMGSTPPPTPLLARRSVIAATDAPVYDPSCLDALVTELGDDGVDVRTELIQAFLDDSGYRLEALRSAHDDASGEVLRSAAHALKSASATLGLLVLSAAAADIEGALRAIPDTVDVAFEATQLISEFQRATAALRSILNPDGPHTADPADTANSVPAADTANTDQPEISAALPATVYPGGRVGSASAVPTVLVVDDDAVSRKVCVAMLTKMGYRAEVAVNGSDALDDLERSHYAAVLMDCGMPVLDGYQTTRELRRREGNDRHTPVIALTAANMAPDRVRCAAAGMDEYLTKPINAVKLAVALQYWIRGIGSRSTWLPAGTGSWWLPGDKTVPAAQ